MSAHTEGPWFLELTDTTLWVGPKKAHSDKVSEVVTFINAGPEYRQEYRAKAEDAPDYRGMGRRQMTIDHYMVDYANDAGDVL